MVLVVRMVECVISGRKTSVCMSVSLAESMTRIPPTPHHCPGGLVCFDENVNQNGSLSIWPSVCQKHILYKQVETDTLTHSHTPLTCPHQPQTPGPENRKICFWLALYNPPQLQLTHGAFIRHILFQQTEKVCC